jgi:NAD(P)-dependent dehydrogenase (short-subunit alcohol dehydrogenase family)
MAGVIVTGATSSIGLSLARHLIQNKVRLGLLGRDSQNLRSLKRELDGLVAIEHLDFEHELEGISVAVSNLHEKLGGVSALVAAHGVIKMSPLRSSSLSEWEGVLKTNLLSNVELLKAFRNARNGDDSIGRVVLLSSVASSRASSGLSAYAASKAALESLVRSAATEFARDKILVNSLQLGLLESGMGSEIRNRIGKDRFSEVVGSYPLGIGRDVDALGAIQFLLSEQSNWITGTNLLIDGGFSVA